MNSARKRIQSLFDKIYPNENEKFQDILNLLDKLPVLNEKTRRVLDQKDALLIAYPQQIHDDSETFSPLNQLARFYNDRLSDCFSGVHLLPFFPSSSDGGFAVRDYQSIDPHWGEWHDLRLFDCDLMFDAVFNHSSSYHHWFRKWLNGDPAYDNYFIGFPERPAEGSELYEQLNEVVRPRTSDLLTGYSRNGKPVFVWTTFSPDQVDLNFAEPKVLIHFLEILADYVLKGSTFVRIDAVPFLWKELGTPCLHHENTHRLVQLFRSFLDCFASHVELITESNVPHKENISYLGDGHNEAQLVYNFSLAPLIMYSLTKGDASPLKTWVSQLKPLPESTHFFNFTATHDGVGVRPLEGILPDEDILQFAQEMEKRGAHISYRTWKGQYKPYELNITWASALEDKDPELHLKKILCSYAMSFAFPGIPGVYFHNLVGSKNYEKGYNQTGHKRDINRQMFQKSALLKLIDDHPFHSKVFEETTKLLKMRSEMDVFHPQASFEQLDSESGLWVVKRQFNGQTALMIFNVTDRNQEYFNHKLAPYEFLIISE